MFCLFFEIFFLKFAKFSFEDEQELFLNMHWGSFEVFLTDLRAVEMDQMQGHLYET